MLFCEGGEGKTALNKSQNQSETVTMAMLLFMLPVHKNNLVNTVAWNKKGIMNFHT